MTIEDGNEEESEEVREFEDRVTVKLLESVENFEELMSLAAPELADTLDFRRAVSVRRTLIRRDLSKRDTDVVFRVPLKGSPGRVIWLYLLLEHISTRDREILIPALDFMAKLMEKQYRRWRLRKIPHAKRILEPVIAIVFYTGARPWQPPFSLAEMMAIPDSLRRYIPVWDTIFLSLHATDSEALKQAGTAMAQVLRAWQVCDAPPARFRETLADVAGWLDQMPDSAAEQWEQDMTFLYQLILNKRTAEEGHALRAMLDTRVTRHREALEVIKMTGAQELRNRGRDEGRQEGRQEGRHDRDREITMRMLMRKFHLEQDAAQALLARVSDERLRSLPEDLIDASSLTDLNL